MLARCPGCGTVLEDPGTTVHIECPQCGTRMASMVRQMATAQDPHLRQMAEIQQQEPPSGGGLPSGPSSIQQGPPHQWAPPNAPPPGYQAEPPAGYPTHPLPPPLPADPPVNPIVELWRAVRALVHAVALFAIFLLMALVVVDLLVLVWSWWPVSEGALQFDSRSAIFIIVPAPVGETAMSGVQAMASGVLLVVMGGVLYAIKRSQWYPGLGGSGTAFMAAITIITGAGVVILGAYLAGQGHLWESAPVTNILPIPLALMIVRFSLLAQWHSIMIGAILMSAAALIYYEGPPLLRTVRRSLGRMHLPPIRTDNALITIFRMYLAILGFYVIYFAILSYITVEPEVPAFEEMPLWEQLHAFAEASVWEEILSRVFMLGIPLLIYHIWTFQKRDSNWRYVVGGGFSIDTAVFVLIVLQALIFALAHVAGWDLWKVLPTMISGIAFGYLWLKKGLWASIILHFTFDYLGMTGPALEEWGIDAGGAMNVIYGFFALIGVVLMVHYAVIILREGPAELKEALTERPAEAARTPNGKA